MSEYLAPGVYIEEIPSGNKPIEAAGTSTAGMIGMTARGPVGQPTLVTSQGQFARVFGGLLDPQIFTDGRDALPYAAEGFFTNGGSRLYIVRVVGEGAKEATLNLVAQNTSAKAKPVLAEAVVVLGATPVKQLALTQAEAVEKGSFLIVDGAASEVVEVDQVTGDGPGKTVTLTAPLTNSHSKGVKLLPVKAVLKVYARSPGVWGDSLRTLVRPANLISTKVNNDVDSGGTSVQLDSAFGLYPGSAVNITIDDATGEQITMQVVGVDTDTGVVQFAKQLGANLTKGMSVVSQEFSLTVERIENGKAVESETFESLSLAEQHPNYVLKVIGSWDADTQTPSTSGGSNLIRLEYIGDDIGRDLPLVANIGRFLVGGDDDTEGVQEESYRGEPSENPNDRTGIFAMENEPAVSIVAVPGQTSVMVQKALVAHCEHMRYRFAVLDTPIGADLAAARAHRQNFDSTRCAIYYPSLERADSFGAPGDRRVISPSGHILGIYARTDTTRGVHKAPANEVVRGILAFDNKLDKGAQDILNPINLNCFRDFRSENRGLRVYGARVATSDPEFKYINVRRLLLMIAQSLDTGLQWAVFEPNDKMLWDTVKQSVTGFLTTIWRSGALEGQKAEEAFYVNIGYNVTMTQSDIDNGRLIVEIGVAPVKPAEFVIVKISQKTREAQD